METPAEEPSADITGLLLAWSAGEEDALQRLSPIVHRELKRIAQHQMLRERREHTLQPTALVNEAFLRMVNVSGVKWQDRAHFFALAAQLMRRILVTHAVARAASKRGGAGQRVQLKDDIAVAPGREVHLIALDEALEKLAAFDQRKAKVVELRFFGGLSVDETAAALHVSTQTVMRDWSLAKSWLARELYPASS